MMMETAGRSMPQAVDPDVFFAERDFDLRRGGGMEEDRPMILYTDIEKVLARPDGAGQIRKFAVAMHGPTKAGVGTDPIAIAMPAEKFQKWWGQGYRPSGYVAPPAPPPPTRWLPSMVDDAIAGGLPIPEEMRPPGYYGPTFKAGAVVADVLVGDEPDGGPAPTIYRCPAPGCARFFDSQDGVNGHARSHQSQPATADELAT